jgi:hypothetical protein
MQDRTNDYLADPAPENPDDLVYFELIDSITVPATPIGGGSGLNAYLCDASGNRYQSSQITVWDHAAPDRDAPGAAALNGGTSGSGDTIRGARGAARYDARSGNLVIEWVQRLPRSLFGLATAAVNTTDSNFTVNGITSADSTEAVPFIASSSTTALVSNWCGWGCASAGAKVMFELTALSGGVWQGNFVQGPCPPSS